MMTQATRLVILAAGVGSRLLPSARAKALVRVAGLTLLERSIVAAHESGFEEFVVVTGHEHDRVALEAFDVSRRRGVRVQVVYNPRYREGNALSVLVAAGIVGDAPFALVMADHVFAPALLRRIRMTPVTAGEVVAVVDRSMGRAAGVDPVDAMKVRLADDKVAEIGKELPAYDAFDVGAFICRAAVLDAIREADGSGDTALVAAVQRLACNGTARALSVADDEWWFDVDTPADLRRGTRHLFRGSGKPRDGAVAARLNRAISQRFITPILLGRFPSITPNQVTIIAFAAALAGAAALAFHAPIMAALLITAASALDGSDGEVARLAHRSSRFGSFLDAVLDRASDGMLFTGAGVYLATSNDLAAALGPAHLPLAIGIVGAALVGHLLVSYTTAKAAVDLGHTYGGVLLAGGRGRDLRLLLVTLGALGAAVHAASLLVALAVVAVLCTGIVAVRLRSSGWTEGAGARYTGVRAVALDFDGTVVDSMTALAELGTNLLSAELGLEPNEARRRYLATAGDDFRTQLDVIAPGRAGLDAIADKFEATRERLMGDFRPFADVEPAIERLGIAGLPTLVCSSTRAELVQAFCRRFDLARTTTIDGWRADHPKADQLRCWAGEMDVAPEEVLFVGDAVRDAAIAQAAGVRFVGLARPGQPDLFIGSGIAVVTSLGQLVGLVTRARRSPVTPARASAVANSSRDQPSSSLP
jgi:choline kinase/phosphoglycolate phosphatase-like HAD superfamily hydrolase/phosphatidylglycerophosphate synthase